MDRLERELVAVEKVKKKALGAAAGGDSTPWATFPLGKMARYEGNRSPCPRGRTVHVSRIGSGCVSTATGVVNIQPCKRACERMRACNSFTHGFVEKKCWFKTAKHNLQSSAQTSWHRNGPKSKYQTWFKVEFYEVLTSSCSQDCGSDSQSWEGEIFGCTSPVYVVQSSVV